MKRIHVNRRNPILPIDLHIPDCEAHLMPDGHMYLYGSLDQKEGMFCSEQYVVISTGNMNQWTIHETAFDGNSVHWFDDPVYPKYQGVDWTKPTPFIKKMMSNLDMAEEKKKFEAQKGQKRPPLLFAPDCIYRNGMYYLYFCMPDESEGVAVSSYPEGPFRNPVQLPCGGIDPAVFIDEDQEAYYYWGQLAANGTVLKDDMISFEPKNNKVNILTEKEHFFHEGSSVRKIGDAYYMVYTCIERGKPTSLGYATARSPLGPFEYRGIIIDNDGCDPMTWNNHGSIQSFQDEWYVFYHRSSRGSKEFRRLCIEKIKILDDGSIPEVSMTSQGIGHPFSNGEIIYGYQACSLKGEIYIGPSGQSESLMNISDGDHAIFRYVYSSTGFQRIEIEAQGSGGVEIYLDEQKIATVQIESKCTRSFLLEKYVTGTYQTLKLVFRRPDHLKIEAITLF